MFERFLCLLYFSSKYNEVIANSSITFQKSFCPKRCPGLQGLWVEGGAGDTSRECHGAPLISKCVCSWLLRLPLLSQPPLDEDGWISSLLCYHCGPLTFFSPPPKSCLSSGSAVRPRKLKWLNAPDSGGTGRPLTLLGPQLPCSLNERVDREKPISLFHTCESLPSFPRKSWRRLRHKRSGLSWACAPPPPQVSVIKLVLAIPSSFPTSNLYIAWVMFHIRLHCMS